MASNPQLSIVVVLQNAAGELEEPLTQLLEIRDIPVEIILVDDASSDHTSELVSSLLDNYGSDHHFFYPLEEPRGRGNALNFAIEQINAPYVWIVDKLENLNTGFLNDALNHLRETTGGFIYHGSPPIPDNLPELIKEHYKLLSLVDDRHFIWRWSDIPAEHRFFNPFWDKFHGLELAIRMSGIVQHQHADPVFEDTPDEPSPTLKRSYFQSLLHQPELTTTLREEIFRMIRTEDEVVLDQNRNYWIEEQFEQAQKQVKEGSPRAALDTLNAILEVDPENRKVEDLKFTVLNRMNRYVEAAEIRHRKDREDQAGEQTPSQEITGQEEPEAPGEPQQKEIFQENGGEAAEEETEVHHPEEPEHEPAPEKPSEPLVTLIIPTAGNGLPDLEACLFAVDQHCDPDLTRLIIVDNASLDDTFEYLEELKKKEFFGCEVLVNSRNYGFGASVNQALEKVTTPYVCVMHNDVTLVDNAPLKLIQLLEHTDVDLLAPTAEYTAIEAQKPRSETVEDEVEETSYLDSFMLVFRSDIPVRFDEEYGPAFFDDLDLCNQVRTGGGSCGVAVNVKVDHKGGSFLSGFGLSPMDKLYWRNQAFFNQKWKLEPQITDDFSEYDELTQLALIGEVINIFYPEPHLVEYIKGLLTSEMRTELMESRFTAEALDALIRAMAAVNERELMRRFEEQLADFEINEDLYYLLVQFYFDNNIFSRCLKYIEALDGKESFRFSFYRLKIAVAERDLSLAVSLLEQLMEINPQHPGLLKLAGDIHKQTGNDEESDKFYLLASQLDPFRFSKGQPAG